MDTYSTRRASKEDVDTIFPLLLESQLFQKRELEKESIKNIQVFKDDLLQNLKDWVNQDDKLYIVALSGKQEVVGYVLGFIDTSISSRGSLADLYVVPEHRNKGLGKLLTNLVLGWMKEKGMKSVVLTVHKDNNQALSLYENMDFNQKPDNYILLERNLV